MVNIKNHSNLKKIIISTFCETILILITICENCLHYNYQWLQWKDSNIIIISCALGMLKCQGILRSYHILFKILTSLSPIILIKSNADWWQWIDLNSAPPSVHHLHLLERIAVVSNLFIIIYKHPLQLQCTSITSSSHELANSNQLQV